MGEIRIPNMVQAEELVVRVIVVIDLRGQGTGMGIGNRVKPDAHIGIHETPRTLASSHGANRTTFAATSHHSPVQIRDKGESDLPVQGTLLGSFRGLHDGNSDASIASV